MRSRRRGVRDIFDENSTYAPIAYLPDETGDILCGRLRLGTEPLRCNEGQSVVATEVPKRVVRGNDGPAARGKPGNHLADFHVEGLKFVHIGLAIPIERAGMSRIDLGQRCSNVVHVHHGMAEALPGMGVEGAMVMGFVIVVRGMLAICAVLVSDWLDAVGRHHTDTAEFRSVDQPVQPAFKLQAVDDNNLRFADGPGICRGWPVNMRVTVRTDERRDIDVLASDSLHHVAEDREGSNHRDRFEGLCGARNGERQNEDDDDGVQKGSADGHGKAPSGFEVTAPEGPCGKTADRAKDQREPVGETCDKDN